MWRVITDRISNGDPSFLTWGRLRALEALGVEIGSHTATHADLTTLTNQRAMDELVRSRRALEDKLGHPVPWLAYPFGAHDERVVQLARRAGYAVAVTTVHGVRHAASRPLELRRLRVLDSTGVAGLEALLSRGSAHRRGEDGHDACVRIEIHYCPVWNGYDQRAASLAAEINSRTGHEATIAEGAKSQFDVLADGRVIFSKQREGRWPEVDEILAAL